MLAREPARHSLRFYVKNARDIPVRAETKNEKALAFAETKAQLLKARDEMTKLHSGSARR